MKRRFGLALVLAVVVLLAACTTGTAKKGTDDAGFEGKIAIVTNTVSQNEEEYRSAEQLIEKYGDKIVHYTWPDNFMQEQEQMVTTMAKIAADADIKAVIINQAVPGTNPAVDKLLETRDDMFIFYYEPQENPPDVATRANLILRPNDFAVGPAMVRQAVAMGATTFIHYSFPRHMSQVNLSGRRDLMRETCEELGIEFIDATSPDPTSEVGLTGAQQFILEDVPKMIEKYGDNTAFFSTNCGMQFPLIKAVVDNHGIYPQPCCPSPYHGFPAALEIEASYEEGGLAYVIEETTRIAAEKDMTGRLSTWPVPASMMGTNVGVEYAIKWINGDVSKEGVDTDVVVALIKDYIVEMTGEEMDLTLEPWLEDGEPLENYQLLLLDYLVY